MVIHLDPLGLEELPPAQNSWQVATGDKVLQRGTVSHRIFSHNLLPRGRRVAPCS